MFNYFTFGYDHKDKHHDTLSDKIVKVDGVSPADCRARMQNLVDDKFAFQYSETEGERLIAKYKYTVVDFQTFYRMVVWQYGEDSGAYSSDES